MIRSASNVQAYRSALASAGNDTGKKCGEPHQGMRSALDDNAGKRRINRFAAAVGAKAKKYVYVARSSLRLSSVRNNNPFRHSFWMNDADMSATAKERATLWQGIGCYSVI